MPLPFLIAGLGIAAGAIGAVGHADAKKTNERANNLIRDAQKLYNNAQKSLEQRKQETTIALINLEHIKKDILNSSMKQFLKGYKRVKHIAISQSVGLEELDNFSIDPQDMLELSNLADIYESSFKSGAAGFVTGVAVASGLGALTVAVTPLATIAAPVLLFTGISASIKADENFEKARVTYSKAEAAAETMSVHELKCKGIIERSKMFDELLTSLNVLFAECARYLDSVTKKKKGFLGLRKITPKRLNDQDMKLIAISRALAGAIKAIIDTPILKKDGNLSEKALEKYGDISDKLPMLTDESEDTLSHNYGVRLLPALQAK